MKSSTNSDMLLVGGMVALFCTSLLFTEEKAWAQASALNNAVQTKENMVASVPRPDQQKAVEKKLADLKKKTGKRPNILILMADDLGYGDVGVYGGGISVGAATPNIDQLALEGLRLTSTYSQPTCTPTRSAIVTGRLPVRTGLYRPILAGDKLTANPWDGETTVGPIQVPHPSEVQN